MTSPVDLRPGGRRPGPRARRSASPTGSSDRADQQRPPASPGRCRRPGRSPRRPTSGHAERRPGRCRPRAGARAWRATTVSPTASAAVAGRQQHRQAGVRRVRRRGAGSARRRSTQPTNQSAAAIDQPVQQVPDGRAAARRRAGQPQQCRRSRASVPSAIADGDRRARAPAPVRVRPCSWCTSTRAEQAGQRRRRWPARRRRRAAGGPGAPAPVCRRPRADQQRDGRDRDQRGSPARPSSTPDGECTGHCAGSRTPFGGPVVRHSVIARRHGASDRRPGQWTRAPAARWHDGGRLWACLTCGPGPPPTVGPWPAPAPCGAPPA